MSIITDVYAREILDSRGNPTVEVEVVLDDGSFGRAAVPVGRLDRRVRGRRAARRRLARATSARACCTAVENVNDDHRRRARRHGRDRPARRRRRAARARRHREQGQARRERHPRRVAGRARKAAAESTELTLYSYIGGANAHLLPVPMMNILNGGAHADNNVDLQEFMVMPVGAPTFAEGLRWCAEIYHTLKKVLQDRKLGDRRRRRGRLRARTSRATRTRSQVIVEAVREGRLHARRADHVRARPRHHRVLRRRARRLRARRRGPRAHERRDGRLLGGPRRPLPDHLASRTAWPRRTGTAGSC